MLELEDITDLLDVPELSTLDGSTVKFELEAVEEDLKFEFADEMLMVGGGAASVKTEFDWMENLIRL